MRGRAMEQNIRKSKPYFFNLTEIDDKFSGDKDLAVLNYARSLFYDARRDNCTYYGEVLGVFIETDGAKTPSKILSEVKSEHETMRQNFIKSPYGQWLTDFESRLKNFSGADFKHTVQSAVKTGTMLPLVDWYKNVMQMQTFVNDFLKKHQDRLKYADVLFDLTLNAKNVALILKENGFPNEKAVYEELRDRGHIPERELAEKFIGAYLYQMPIANKARYYALINSYQDGLNKQTTVTPSLWLINSSRQTKNSTLGMPADTQNITKARLIEERLFPSRGKNVSYEK